MCFYGGVNVLSADARVHARSTINNISVGWYVLFIEFEVFRFDNDSYR